MKKIRLSLWAFLSLGLLASSCSLTTTFNLAPEEISGMKKNKIIVTLKDGSSFVMHNAQINEDKLVGVLDNRKTLELDMASIMKVTQKKTDMSLVMILGAAFGVEVLLAIGAATAPSPPPSESCPFIFSFDGQDYVFDAEPYGGAVCQGLKRAEWCELQFLRPAGGRYRVLISNQLQETQYSDELKLLIVDHPREVTVAPEPDGAIRTFGRLLPPQSAVDSRGRDVASLLAADDDRIWQPSYEDTRPGTDETLREDLILEFSKPRTAQTAKLLVKAGTTPWGSQMAKRFLELFGTDIPAWYDEVNRHGPAFYQIMSWYAAEELYLLKLLVQTPRGWEPRGMIYSGGPFVSEKKAYELNISDIQGETLKIRIQPPLNFWRIDQFAVAFDKDVPVACQELSPIQAVDRAGRDWREALAANDDRYFVMPNIDDSAELVFDAPPPVPGANRTVFLKAAGYYEVHLEGKGKPQTDLIDKIQTVPGTTLRLAYEDYRRQKGVRDK